MANTEAPVTDRPPQSRPDCCYSARGATAVVAKERRQRLVVERTATAGPLRAPILRIHGLRRTRLQKRLRCNIQPT